MAVASLLTRAPLPPPPVYREPAAPAPPTTFAPARVVAAPVETAAPPSAPVVFEPVAAEPVAAEPSVPDPVVVRPPVVAEPTFARVVEPVIEAPPERAAVTEPVIATSTVEAPVLQPLVAPSGAATASRTVQRDRGRGRERRGILPTAETPAAEVGPRAQGQASLEQYRHQAGAASATTGTRARSTADAERVAGLAATRRAIRASGACAPAGTCATATDTAAAAADSSSADGHARGSVVRADVRRTPATAGVPVERRVELVLWNEIEPGACAARSADCCASASTRCERSVEIEG